MATRKRGSGSGGDSSRAFAVVVEQLRGDFKAFGERLDGVEQRLGERIDDVEQRLGGRIDGLGGCIDTLESRVTDGFARVDDRLERLEEGMGDVKHELELVKSAVLEHGRMLESKVDRDEVEAVVARAMKRTST